MSTFTKEQLIEKLQHRISVASGFPESEKAQMDLELARIALASLEAEAVAYADPQAFHNFSVYRAGETDNKRMGREWMWANPDAGLIPVYTAPTAPVSVKIPPEKPHTEGPLADGWNACRAAMLKHSEPFIVTSDHRMMEMPQVEAINAVTAMLQGAEPVSNRDELPDGWVLVPVEPTHEMLEAGDEQFGTYDVYRRMIAAPQQGGK